ncbi:MAG: LysR substrate-binding domain-containing protein [Nannocystaceae bacterium]
MRFENFGVTIRQLQYAVAVGETRSFRRAAERCHVSQPSLSAQIAELEGCLEVRLFDRNKRRVVVTGAGEELLSAARRTLASAKHLLGVARICATPMAGPLRIGAIPTVAPYLLPVLDPGLRHHFPGLSPRWFEDKTEILVQQIIDGTLDAALLAAEAPLGPLHVEALVTDDFVLACSADASASRATGATAKLDQLHDQPVLLLDDGHCFRDQALDVCAGAGARELDFRATSLATLVQMVVGGLGVTLLPMSAVESETRGRRLSIRPFEPPAPHRTLAFAWRRGAAVEALMKALSETARELLTVAGKDLRRAPTVALRSAST